MADAQRRPKTPSTRSKARSEMLSLWLVWTTEKDNPSGFPSWETEVSTFFSFMHHCRPRLLAATRCVDKQVMKTLLQEDCLP